MDVVNLRKVKFYKRRKSPQDVDFKSLFRFEERNVQWLANQFLGDNRETRGGALSPEMKMKIFLRYVADPGFQNGIGEELGVEQSTVSRTVSSVMSRIVEQAPQWIKFPTNENEVIHAKETWLDKYNFPTAVGVLDCTHVRIPKPQHHGDEYINRKGWPSINVQATCDARYMFTSVDIRWPGSVHDARIWRNCEVRQIMARTKDTVLIADQGYGIEPWLMTPFRNPQTDRERKFNKLLAKERVIIEQCFGQLKRRFPILGYVCRIKLENVPNMILACVILHNIARSGF